MSRRLFFSASLSVVAMAAFALTTHVDMPVKANGAATEVAAPLVSLVKTR